MAKLQNPKEQSQPVKSDKKDILIEFEKWKLERNPEDKTKLIRFKLIRKVMILQEHADMLNEQRENTLIEYVR